MAVKVGVPRDATIPSSSSLCDAPGLNVLAHASENEITAAIYEVSTKFFGACGGEMAGEQVTWRLALARATWNPAVVEAGLRAALIARGLGDWQLETFDTAAAVWSAWMQFASRNPVEALEARDCWGYNDALEARQIWSARGVGANWRAWEPWTTTSQEHKLDERTIGSVAVQRDFGAAKAAYAAHFALTLWFASRQGWVQKPADLLAVGLRESYAQGLEMAMPIRPRILGWAMALSAQLPQAGVHS